MLIDSGYFDLDLEAGKDNLSHKTIEHHGTSDRRHATSLQLWMVSAGDSDPVAAVVRAFSVITRFDEREAFERLTADATIDNGGASITDIDVSKRSHTHIKITTPEAGKKVRLHYALFDNRSV